MGSSNATVMGLPTGTKLMEVAHQFLATRLTVSERMAVGKKLRDAVSREFQAFYSAAKGQRDPISILEKQAKTRVPELLPIRYGRMRPTPYTFLRGAAAVMAADLAPLPTTEIEVQVCGDMHLSNFGVFGSAERNLVFGINDFDENLPAPFEWDLKRLATSAVVAGRSIGENSDNCKDAARAVTHTYRKRMHEYAKMGHLDVWYARIVEAEILKAISLGHRKLAEQIMVKACKSTHLQVLHQLTDLVDDERRIKEDPPLDSPRDQLRRRSSDFARAR